MASRDKTKRAPAPERRETSPDFKDQLVCNLELQQTVAAAQIQKLEKSHAELETSRSSFDALYERSPIGYVTLDGRGHICDANLTAAKLLGFERERLLRLPFNLL